MTGLRGNYIHVGGAGLHYRARLGGAKPREAGRRPALPATQVDVPATLTDIESGDVVQMTDCSSDELLAEIAEKHRKVEFSALLALFGAVALLVAWATLPSWAVWALAVALVIAYLYLRRLDAERKTVVLEYALDEPLAQAWAAFDQGFGAISQSATVWHLAARGRNDNWKRSGGATQSVRRQRAWPVRAKPDYFQCNVTPAMLPVGRQRVYFFPDRLLVFDGSRVGAVSYADLSVEPGSVNFVEEQTLPSDATVVSHTWRYVNKKGGADKRFKGNRQIPVASYGCLRLSSGTGLNEEIQTSLRDAPQSFARGVQLLDAALRGLSAPTPPTEAAARVAAIAAPVATAVLATQMAETPTQPVGPGPDGFRFDIVGEAHYQEALQGIATPPATFPCRIVPEPTTPHDRNAIRVDAVGHGTVGYFSREDALRYRAMAQQLAAAGAVGHCDGCLFGGWDDDVQIGVRLSILPPQAWDPSIPEHRNAPTLRQPERLEARRISIGPNPKGFKMEVSAELYCKTMTRQVDGGRTARGESAVFEAALIPQPGIDGLHEVIVHAEGHGVVGKLPTATVNRYAELWAALDRLDAVATCQGMLSIEGESADGQWYGVKLSALPPKKAAQRATGGQ